MAFPILDLNREFKPSIHIRLIDFRKGKKIANHHLWCRIQKDVTLNPADLPVILVFQILSVTPAVDFNRDRILPSTDIRGDIEFCRSFTSLTVADFIAVNPDIHGGLHSSKMEEHLTSCPAFGNGEISLVRSHRVVIMRNMGRIGRKWIFRIGVDRNSVTQKFPVGRDLDIIPVAGIIIISVEINRPVRRLLHPVEFPDPIHRPEIRGLIRIVSQCCSRIRVRDISAVGRFLVPSDHSWIFPVLHIFLFCSRLWIFFSSGHESHTEKGQNQTNGKTDYPHSISLPAHPKAKQNRPPIS